MSLLKLFLSVCFVSMLAQTAISLEHPKNWLEALDLSMAENKPILINFYFDSCPPCHSLHEEVFDVDTLRNEIEERFIIYWVDIYNDEDLLAEKFKPQKYPTIIVVNEQEKVLHYFSGYEGSEDFFSRLFLIDEERNLNYFKSNFDSQKDDKKFIEDYVFLLNRLGLVKLEVFERYIENQHKFSETYVQILGQYFLKKRKYRKIFKKNYNRFKKYTDERTLRYYLWKTFNYESYNKFYRNTPTSIVKSQEYMAYKEQIFLNESDHYRDSIFTYRTLHLFNKEGPEFHNIQYYNYWLEYFYKLFDYEILDVYDIDLLYSICFDIGVTNLCEQNVLALIKAIEGHPKLNASYEYQEIIAICYYKLGLKEKGNAQVALVNKMAFEEGVKYKPLIQELFNSGLLKKVGRKCKGK